MEKGQSRADNSQSSQIVITDDSSQLSARSVQRLLQQTFWAKNRSSETIKKSLENSICFGAFCDGKQVGFARVVTDKCTFAYLCDVIVDEEFRGHGISKQMMNRVMSHADLRQFRLFLLATKDAHGLYTKYGFLPSREKTFMEILREGV
jgi:GNAT superfamily N-acetyltransferase